MFARPRFSESSWGMTDCRDAITKTREQGVSDARNAILAFVYKFQRVDVFSYVMWFKERSKTCAALDDPCGRQLIALPQLILGTVPMNRSRRLSSAGNFFFYLRSLHWPLGHYSLSKTSPPQPGVHF